MNRLLYTAGIAAIFLVGCAARQPAGPVTSESGVALMMYWSEPLGAQVSVDGVVLGLTPGGHAMEMPDGLRVTHDLASKTSTCNQPLPVTFRWQSGAETVVDACATGSFPQVEGLRPQDAPGLEADLRVHNDLIKERNRLVARPTGQPSSGFVSEAVPVSSGHYKY